MQLESLLEYRVKRLLCLELLLTLQVHVVPLVLGVEVVDVDYVLARLRLLLEHLVGLVVVRLKELVEVEVGEWWAAVRLNVRRGD